MRVKTSIRTMLTVRAEVRDGIGTLRTVLAMASHFKRVYRSNGYCRTAGVLGARSENGQVIFPIEHPIRASVRESEAAENNWSSALNPEWAELASQLWAHYSPDAAITGTVAFDTGVPDRHNGLMVKQAAAIAAVKAVASATETPINCARLTEAESKLWLPTGLAHGAPVRTSATGSSEVLSWDRWLWVWAKPVGTAPTSEEAFGDVDGTYMAGFTGASQSSENFKEVLDGCDHIIGGFTEGTPMAALFDIGRTSFDEIRSLVSKASSALGPQWYVQPGRSSVPSENPN